MQSIFLPVARSGGAPPASPRAAAVSTPFPFNHSLPLPRSNDVHQPNSYFSPFSLPSANLYTILSSPHFTFKNYCKKTLSFTPIAAAPNGVSDTDKLSQVSKRLEYTSRYFKRLGSFGFWGQLICSIVAGVILSFSTIITGKVTSPVTFCATASGIAAAFISVFWSFGHIRLADRLRKTANNPSKGIPPGNSPVLALDVFLVQASANTILSHFLGLICSLELLRSVTVPSSEGVPVAKIA